MFNCSALTKKNLNVFENLNSQREIFNELNLDFFQEYCSIIFPFNVLMLKKVTLLRHDTNFVGYYWINSRNKFSQTINAISIDRNIDFEKGFATLVNNIKGKFILKYSCLKNDVNFYLLEQNGFLKAEGTFDMEMLLSNDIFSTNIDKISFHTVKKGVDEKIRCEIQNDIFKNTDRVPLTIEDMFFDEFQKYYLPEGSILIKHNNTYIGYGQVIIEFNKATIVNFGTLKAYRNLGYAKLLLIHLLNIIKKNNFDKAYIKVKADNEKAVNLYSSMGFKITGESFDWYLKRQ